MTHNTDCVYPGACTTSECFETAKYTEIQRMFLHDTQHRCVCTTSECFVIIVGSSASDQITISHHYVLHCSLVLMEIWSGPKCRYTKKLDDSIKILPATMLLYGCFSLCSFLFFFFFCIYLVFNFKILLMFLLLFAYLI